MPTWLVPTLKWGGIGLLAPSPDDHLDLDPVLLDIDTGGQEQTPLGHDTDPVALAPLVQALPLRRLGLLLERQSEDRVDEALHEVGRLLGLLVNLRGIGPAKPAHRAIKAGEVEPGGPPISKIARDITVRKRLEERQRFLTAELSHRVKTCLLLC
jgi:hypothetical protein